MKNIGSRPRLTGLAGIAFDLGRGGLRGLVARTPWAKTSQRERGWRSRAALPGVSFGRLPHVGDDFFPEAVLVQAFKPAKREKTPP